MEPRKASCGSRRRGVRAEGHAEALEQAWRQGPAGVREPGHVPEDSPGTWEALSPPSEESRRRGEPGDQCP